MRLQAFKFMLCVPLAFAFALVLSGCGSGSAKTQISIAIVGGSATIGQGDMFSLTATVSGDSSGSGVTWTLNGAGTLSGQTGSSVNYLAPTSVPTNPAVSIAATSVTDTTKTSVLAFSVVAGPNALKCSQAAAPRGNESALTTPVAFLLKGSDANGAPIAYVGSFTADGKGGVTAGDVDVAGFDVVSGELPVVAAGSTYSYGADGRGCLYLQFDTDTSKRVPANSAHPFANSKHVATFNGFTRRVSGMRGRPANSIHAADGQISLASLSLSFVLSSPTGPGRIIAFSGAESGQIVAGQMHAQSPADFSVSKLSSRYAFGADGWSSANPNGPTRVAAAGSFTNTAGTWTLGVADENINGNLFSDVAGGAGSVDATIDATTGRGTGSYVTSPSAGLGFEFTYYVVNGGDFYFISNEDPTESEGLLAGRALQAAATSSPWDGYYITASSGLEVCYQCVSLAGNEPVISTMHASSGSATGTIDGPPNTYTWSYTFDPASGRVAFAGASSLPVAYVTSGTSDDDVAAFTVGTDSEVSSGFIVAAGTSAPDYSAASLSGTYAYGTTEDASVSVGAAAGVATFDGTSSYTTNANTVVVGEEGTGETANAPTSGTYVVNSDGTGTLSSPTTPFVTNGNIILAFDDSGPNRKILQIYFKQSAEPAKGQSQFEVKERGRSRGSPPDARAIVVGIAAGKMRVRLPPS